MNRPSVTPGTTSDSVRRFTRDGCSSFWRVAGSCSLLFGMTAAIAAGQVITIDKQGNATNGTSAPVDRRFAQIQPTKVPLDNSVMDAKTRQELIRVLQAEQGFAMRPFPRGHKGLMLVANGPLSPAGEDYLNLVTSQGLSAKPGETVPDPHGSTPDRAGEMGPVQFPKQKPDDYPDASKLPRTHPAQTSDEDADSRPSATDTKKAASGSDASKQESGDSGQAQQDATKPH